MIPGQRADEAPSSMQKTGRKALTRLHLWLRSWRELAQRRNFLRCRAILSGLMGPDRPMQPNTYFDPEVIRRRPRTLLRLARFDPFLGAMVFDMQTRGIRGWEYALFLQGMENNLGGQKIVDLGTGSSPFARYLSSLGADVYTLDLPRPFDKDRGNTLKGRHVQANFLALPLRDESLDCVLSISAVEHLQQQEREPLKLRSYEDFRRRTRVALWEMARVTRTGGYLYLTTDFYEPERQRTDRWWQLMTRNATSMVALPIRTGRWRSCFCPFCETAGSSPSPLASTTFASCSEIPIALITGAGSSRRCRFWHGNWPYSQLWRWGTRSITRNIS